MADENIIQILLQAKDLASEAVKRLQANLEEVPASAAKVNDSTSSLKETFSSLKEHWVAVSAAIVAGWLAVEKAAEAAKLGAAALQAEESFRNVTASYDVEGDKLLAKMKEVSVGMIDESALMQRAVKALQQGLSEDQIVNLLEISRSSARVAGTDITAAFDGITNAVANQTTRALKLYGIVIDNNKAFEDYAKVLGVSKDALTEQQQSQALANAAIAEGQRQMKAMGDITLNASDKIQQAAAQMTELKETIGKGVLIAIQAVGGGVYWLAAGVMVLASAWMKQGAAMLFAIGRFDEAKKLNQEANTMFEAAGETAAKGMKMWDGISLSTSNVAEATKGLAKQQRDAADAATLAAAKQKQASETLLAVQQAKVKSLEVSNAYETALEKKRYEEGEISLNEYIAFVKAKQSELTQAMIKEKQLQLAALQADPKVSAADRVKKEIEIQGQITDIMTKSKTDQLKVEEELTASLKKEQTNAFDNWKSLQELKLQSLKANMDLQNAIDDAAVKSGSLAESQSLQNKLDRLKIYSDAQIQKAQETADRIAELEAQGFYKTKEERDKAQEEYKQAISEKENLQLQLQQNIVTSEQQIAETQKKEATDAEKYISDLLNDRDRQEAVKYQEKLDELDKYYKQGLISAEDYYAAIDVLQSRAYNSFEEDLHNRSEQLNLAINIVADRRRQLEDTLQGMTDNSFEDVKKYFKNWGNALSTNVNDMQNEIDQFMRHTTWVGYNTFWNASLYGRKLVDMVGTSVYAWAQKVTDYIQYVKGLMESLKEKIMSYQDELDQLRGNEVAIIDRWYETEKAKLEEQYSGDLKNTAEYYKAKELLDELYREKKKRAEEEEAAAKQQQVADQTTNDSSGSSGGGSGGLVSTVAKSYPSLEDFAKQLQSDTAASMSSLTMANYLGGLSNLGSLGENNMTKKVDITASLDVNSSDPDYIRRLFEDDIWPLFQRKLELIGVKL